MKVFIASLLSRKLWLAVAAAIVFIVNKDYAGLTAVVIGYFTANVIDTKVSTK